MLTLIGWNTSCNILNQFKNLAACESRRCFRLLFHIAKKIREKKTGELPVPLTAEDRKNTTQLFTAFWRFPADCTSGEYKLAPRAMQEHFFLLFRFGMV